MATVVTWKDYSWTFDENDIVQGTFWNGDPWVYRAAGNLTLSAISPTKLGSALSTKNGSVKNPQGSVFDQAWDGRLDSGTGPGTAYNDAAQLALPATLTAGDTVVTCISTISAMPIGAVSTKFGVYSSSDTGSWVEGDTFLSSINGTTGTFHRRFTPNNDFYCYVISNTDGTLQAGETLTNQTRSGTMVIKTSGVGATLSYIASYGCITVVGQDLTGTDYFRPPYVGTTKPLHAVSDMNTSLLRGFTLPFDPRTNGNSGKLIGNNDGTFGAQNTDLTSRYSLDFDFLGGTANMNRHAIPHGLAYDYYGAGGGRRYGSNLSQMAVLAHCGGTLQSGQDYSAENIAKYLVQYGIDHYPMVFEDETDNCFNGLGGFAVGRLWPIIFAGLMLDNEDYKTVASRGSSTKTDNAGDPFYFFYEQAMAYTTNGQPASFAYKHARPLDSYTRGTPLFGIQSLAARGSNPHSRIDGTYKYHCLSWAQNGYFHCDATVRDYLNDGDYLCTQVGHSFAGVYMAACWMGAQKYFYDGVAQTNSGEAPAFFDFMENWLEDEAMAAKGLPNTVYNQRALVDYGTENAIVVDDDGKPDPYTSDNLYLKIKVKFTNTGVPTITYKGQTHSCHTSLQTAGTLTAGSTYIFRFVPGLDTGNGWWYYYPDYRDYFQGDLLPTQQDNKDIYHYGGNASGWMKLMYRTHFLNKKQPIML